MLMALVMHSRATQPAVPDLSTHDDCLVDNTHCHVGLVQAKVQALSLRPSAELASAGAGTGTCVIYGDPHIVGFDRSHSTSLSLIQEDNPSVGSGDAWLVKSPDVHIQGRFSSADAGKATFLTDLAVGGPFLEGNTLLIGRQGGQVLWNDNEVLRALPSTFEKDGLISATYDAESMLVQDPTQKAKAPGVHIQLPQGVKLLVNRGKNGLGVSITMPKAQAGQEGQCGNFNGLEGDDTTELISSRDGAQIAPGESLFQRPSAELTSAPDGGHRGPVHDAPHGNVHFDGPDPGRGDHHYGNPTGDGSDGLGGSGEPHFAEPGQNPHHAHYGKPTDGSQLGACHFSDPSGSGTAPSGACVIYGDPHIVGFDTSHSTSLSLIQVDNPSVSSGDAWLVKSSDIHIQGRFSAAKGGKATFLTDLAVGGPFLEGNTLLIGKHGGQVLWNRDEILFHLPSKFEKACLISAQYDAESMLVQDPTQKAQAPGIHIQLPQGVKLLVNRGKNGLGVSITMPKAQAGQEGQCGNFNGLDSDDTAELISTRNGAQIALGESLFHRPKAELTGTGTCVIYGDPHIVGFDQGHTKSLSLIQKTTSTGSNLGDTWLVKSEHVHIQGRFNMVNGVKATYLTALAVGGPFLEGNTLLISGQNGRALWNGEEILSSLPSKFTKAGLISANYTKESMLVQDPTRPSRAPGVHIELPLGVKLLVNRGRNGLGVSITMPKAQSGQDGQCGNFNGLVGDDNAEFLSVRNGAEIAPGELLFQHEFGSTLLQNSIPRAAQTQTLLEPPTRGFY